MTRGVSNQKLKAMKGKKKKNNLKEVISHASKTPLKIFLKIRKYRATLKMVDQMG